MIQLTRNPASAPELMLRCVILALAAGINVCGASEDLPALASAVRRPLQIVSLSPAASAFVVDLGAGASLIAVDPESARLPGLGQLPSIELDEAPDLHADLVLVPELRAVDASVFERLRADGGEVIEVAPHDYDDVFALCRDLGARLVGRVRATQYENTMGRELATLGGSFHGQSRPRVIAVLELDPLVVAGGHGFTTDLIELAGGTSITHENDDPTHEREDLTQVTDLARLSADKPDLILVLSAMRLPEHERAAARARLVEIAPVEFFELDAARFWVRDGAATVRRLRTLIEPFRPASSASGGAG